MSSAWVSAVSVHSHSNRQQLAGGLRLLESIRGQTETDTALGRINPEDFVCRTDGYDELSFEGFAQHDVEQRVDAAVGVAHANGDVIGIQKGITGPLHTQMCQLQDVMRRPANEERQAYSDSHPSDLSSAHTKAVLGKWSHRGSHVLEDLEKHHTNDHQRQSERQHKLVESKPVCVCGRIGKEQSASHRSVPQGHEASVHPHRRDGQQREDPHQAHHRHGHAWSAYVVEADGMNHGQVSIQSHDC